jgi:hypothetical protein
VADDFLLFLGPHARDFIAGAMGGVSISFSDKKLTARNLIGNVLGGAITAMLVNPAITELGFVSPLFTSYFLGAAGKEITRKGAKWIVGFVDRITG